MYGGDKDYQNKPHSITSKAFQMFKENKSRVDVAIALNLEGDDVVTFVRRLFEAVGFWQIDNHIQGYRWWYWSIRLSFFLYKAGSIATKNKISRFVEMAGRSTRID